jgi:hypothetical protein
MMVLAVSHWIPVAFVGASERYTNVVVPTLPRANVIAKEVSRMRLGFAVDLAPRMQTRMAFVTMWILVSALKMPVVFAVEME